MQSVLNDLIAIDKKVADQGIQVLPPRCYFKYWGKDGTKVYIPILKARGYPDRLSNKMFRRAQDAHIHALKFHSRYIKMKEFADD